MKTILITGATDGIGLETAKQLLARGHKVLLHGRNSEKLERVRKQLADKYGEARVKPYLADLSDLNNVSMLADAVSSEHEALDVLINNAGVLKTTKPIAANGLDVRFVVNTLAPMLLGQRLVRLMGRGGRIVNLSSAAQAPVSHEALEGHRKLPDNAAYAQSKLALTMWSIDFAKEVHSDGVMVVAVNPGSLLGTKMVKDGYGIDGGDVGIGADVLVQAALSENFRDTSGLYFDNDSGQFANPHPDALDREKRDAVIQLLGKFLGQA
ncbi:SDR family NAD(P)-dependent oxidoreductase [Henriciella sp.]|uniref:SDR family NAD(P)-dependent oxidoreductase n=1 Tax=Henriciella sp. TaxID=1968823 RepID=UPI002636B887|nr:SDR family NAD(P)-dependent oxidoreductase [Henriciella sp.]